MSTKTKAEIISDLHALIEHERSFIARAEAGHLRVTIDDETDITAQEVIKSKQRLGNFERDIEVFRDLP